MTDFTVIAFDPGGTTGWAAMTVDEACLLGTCPHHSTHGDSLDACVAVGNWEWGQIDAANLGSTRAGETMGYGHDAMNLIGENETVNWMLWKCNNELPNAAVALEKFVLDPRAASGKFDLLSPVRIISAFSFGMWAAEVDMPGNHRRFQLINRGDPKRTCTNERMKRWGFKAVVTHNTRHALDASRIAFYFLRDCVGNSEKAREKRWRAWPQHFPDPEVRAKPVRKPNLGERI